MTCCKGPKYNPRSSGDRPSKALAAAKRTVCSLSSSNGPSNRLRWPLGTSPTMLLIAAWRTATDELSKSASASFNACGLG
ncbi:hypothetical protein D3C78_1472390 [compost metagenome]